MKLGLGTVQFGLPYGISGSGAAVPPAEVERILRDAADHGVEVLDTAPAYGTSEELLGRLLPPGGRFRIVTKTPRFGRPVGAADRRIVVDGFRRSLARLGQERLHGLLVHDAGDLLGPGGEHIFEALAELRDSGAVARIGASVYGGEQIERILDRYPVDLVQAPLNVLDQRLVRGGHLEKMKRRGVEVHVRSALLQGLLLMEPQALPPFFDPVRDHLSVYAAELERRGVAPLDAALGFVRQLDGPAAVICGVESLEQLRQLRASFAATPAELDWERFRLDDPRFVDPRNWETAAAAKAAGRAAREPGR